ncbi:MAG: NAD(P)(+) transhydrogenase (Re/Si-specific) subunit beta [Planctomycetes bacterium]|nr:NAD(P)(+) transhydrogenase (Re/Si-specific) subunit beta [Planctomycetota bacterium]
MLITLLNLLAAALFIFGLKKLASVKTARLGNQLAAAGMALAVVVTMVHVTELSWVYAILGILLGSAVGAYAAQKVQMTQMPQMVALFNGLGGLASAFVGIAELLPKAQLYLSMGHFSHHQQTAIWFVAVVLSVLVGGLTFTGSLVAFAKLQELISGKPMALPQQQLINAGLGIACVVLTILGLAIFSSAGWVITCVMFLLVISLVLGVSLTMPIGGADMPVVISLLNSYSGIAGAAAGFAVGEPILVIAGAMVGASGIILTQIMCKAMNRSIANVIFGGFGAEDSSGGGGEYKNTKSTSAEEAAMLFDAAQLAIIVPGYGLAVAQAQHAVREFANLLEKKGCKVLYAIHPVAGRMPGHMNVLLAEANIPYEQLVEMDQINSEFKNADIALVLGANDVVNPAAKTDPKSPIYGMPVLNVEEARTVIMVKRSMNPGFAGIKNELFELENTLMLFGDAKKVVSDLNEQLKQL